MHPGLLLSPVFLAVLQQRVSVSVGAVGAHVRVPSGHGTGGEVVLEKRNKEPRIEGNLTKKKMSCASQPY